MASWTPGGSDEARDCWPGPTCGTSGSRGKAQPSSLALPTCASHLSSRASTVKGCRNRERSPLQGSCNSDSAAQGLAGVAGLRDLTQAQGVQLWHSPAHRRPQGAEARGGAGALLAVDSSPRTFGNDNGHRANCCRSTPTERVREAVEAQGSRTAAPHPRATGHKWRPRHILPAGCGTGDDEPGSRTARAGARTQGAPRRDGTSPPHLVLSCELVRTRHVADPDAAS
mmetsp:Transcript_14270/g.43348  ORF Transcript_14270/g.43348 Transcript_14270/m.43348 type:complete len:227 (+) Transcript_14270:1816-2496(+)